MVELHPPTTVSTAQQHSIMSLVMTYYNSNNNPHRISCGHPLTAGFTLLLLGVLCDAHTDTLLGWLNVTCRRLKRFGRNDPVDVWQKKSHFKIRLYSSNMERTSQNGLECTLDIRSVQRWCFNKRQSILGYKHRVSMPFINENPTHAYMQMSLPHRSERPSSVSNHSCSRQAWLQCWYRHDLVVPWATAWHLRMSHVLRCRTPKVHRRHHDSNCRRWVNPIHESLEPGVIRTQM